MADDKKIEISSTSRIHRLIARVPEHIREYGCWVINGSEDCRSGGVSAENTEDRCFEFYSLSHMFSGRGWLRFNSRVIEIQPGDAVLMPPGQWHMYGGCEGNIYREDSVRFCGRIPDLLCRCGMLRPGVYPFGAVRKLLPLIELARSPEPDAWLKAALALQGLLTEMAESRRRTSPVETLLQTIHAAPPSHWWSVAELAEIRGISIDRLRREFLRHTGMLPKKYLEDFKLRQAAEYLVNNAASVTDTALHFGYVDRYHFSRRFRHLWGLSPEQYRRLFAVRPGKN